MKVSGHITPRPLYPQKRTPVPIECKSGWAAERIWKFLKREISLVPYRLVLCCPTVTISIFNCVETPLKKDAGLSFETLILCTKLYGITFLNFLILTV
jgi:hypothetical protein